jgi:GTPase SAR1 family protein
MIGDSSVGKTSLFKKFIDGTFPTDVISSVGVDFRVKFLSVGDKYVKFV